MAAKDNPAKPHQVGQGPVAAQGKPFATPEPEVVVTQPDQPVASGGPAIVEISEEKIVADLGTDGVDTVEYTLAVGDTAWSPAGQIQGPCTVRFKLNSDKSVRHETF